MRKEIIFEGQKINILRVPWFSQSDTDWLCVVYSIKMVLDFFKNVYDNTEVRRVTPNTDRDELISITKTQPGVGTSVSSSLINDLRKAFPTLEFEIRQTNYEEIEESLDRNNPTIILYNPSFLFINEKGPGHAGVVVGLSDQYIILNNPWYGPAFPLDRSSFERAWELEYNLGIFIYPNPQRRFESNETN